MPDGEAIPIESRYREYASHSTEGLIALSHFEDGVIRVDDGTGQACFQVVPGCRQGCSIKTGSIKTSADHINGEFRRGFTTRMTSHAIGNNEQSAPIVDINTILVLATHVSSVAA
jgi:hypothetical protein